MNTIDFNTQPDGFPLESDATLGFLQSSLAGAINALSKLAGANNIIITGVEESGASVSEGWILHDGELLFFEGGTKSTYWIIEETVVQKANENGTLVDRYFTRKAKFGTGPSQVAYSLLWRATDLQIQELSDYYLAILGAGAGTESWVIIDGLEPALSGAGGIGSGIAIYQGKTFYVPQYDAAAVSEGSPIYLTPAGVWTASSASPNLKFSPWSDAYMYARHRKHMHPQGSVLWIDTAIDDITGRFDGTGLGKWEWLGWAIANGNNGTADRTAAVSGLLPVVKL